MSKSLFEKQKKIALNITVDKEIRETIKNLSEENQISTSKIVNSILQKLKEDNKLNSLKNLEEFLNN